MASLLDKIRCDGLDYIDAHNREPVCSMRDPRMGAVFEIGRLLRDHGITPLRKPDAAHLTRCATSLVQVSWPP